MARGLRWSLIVLATLSACQAMESQGQGQARRDDELARRLTTHLGTMAGITTISLAITSDEADLTWLPGAVPACSARVAVMLSVNDASASEAITAAVRAQLGALLPHACPATITISPIAASARDRGALASVGPFRVAAASKRPLQLTLAAMLIALGALLFFMRRVVAA
ncbi:MAG: hypothetical protein IPL79_05480 [Myxococcales bacterium]|nr:hypothetical protein [Myxococcales bacterium]